MAILPTACWQKTSLARRKLPIRTLLMVFSLFVNAAKGISSYISAGGDEVSKTDNSMARTANARPLAS